MGLGIELQDEFSGRIEGIEDHTNLLGDLLPSFGVTGAYPILAGIDPHGDTVFNRLQIPRFLSEWVDVVSKARTQKEQELVWEIERLACRCSAEVHTYLKFIGD